MPTKKKREALFIAGLAIYLIVLIISGSKLAPASREFPSVIIGTAFLVIGLKLLTYLFPRFKFLDPSGTPGRGKAGQESVPGEQAEGVIPASVFKPAAFMVWIATFLPGAYLFGFLPAIILWLFLFLMLLSKTHLLRALVICACMFTAIYLVFIVMLQVRFPSGVLF